MTSNGERAVAAGFSRTRRALIRSYAVAVAIWLLVPPISGDSAEVILPGKEVSIPANKAWDRSFTLRVRAALDVDFRIEEGKEIDVYLMTRQQDDKASEGTEPSTPEKDFLQHSSGVLGKGGLAKVLDAGDYNVVFRNRGDTPVTVWSSASGSRR